MLLTQRIREHHRELQLSRSIFRNSGAKNWGISYFSDFFDKQDFVPAWSMVEQYVLFSDSIPASSKAFLSQSTLSLCIRGQAHEFFEELSANISNSLIVHFDMALSSLKTALGAMPLSSFIFREIVPD